MASRNLAVTLEGRGDLKLSESNYLATGGEGSVYRAHSTVIKVYTDPNKMTRDGMADKVSLLKTIKHQTIVAPEGLVLDSKNGRPIGYYMPWVEGEPLPRIFTTSGRARLGFGSSDEQALVVRMLDTVLAAHAAGALMVDANELNWLVSISNTGPNTLGNAGPIPRVIDVDSWAVGHWPASVIMPSIRDWHTSGFNPGTDWFAWAVVTFQVWTGIHPYHGRAAGYTPGELERRMKDNVSVFSPDVRVPGAVREFSRIPGGLLAWYQAVFLDRARNAPPDKFAAAPPAAAAQTLRTVVTSSGAITYAKLLTHPEPVLRMWPNGAALLADRTLVDSERKRTLAHGVEPDCEIVRTRQGWLIADRSAAPIFAFQDGHSLRILNQSLAINRIFRAYERLFAVTEHELVELELLELAQPVLTTSGRWNILTNATQWFDNVAIMDVLGSATLLLPLREGGMIQMRCPELDGLTPLAAQAGERFVSVLAADRTGTYRKLEFTFAKDYASYTVWTGASDQAELNLAILPNGVTATVVRDGQLTVFVPANGAITQVRDRQINTGTSLLAWGSKVVTLRDREVWQVSLTN